MKHIISLALCALVALAQDKILDTSAILKENQTAIVDARTNEINYILEIEPSGKIVKKYLSKSEQEALKKSLKLDSIKAKDKSNFRGARHFNGTQSNIKEWRKSKIIYEQTEEWIRLK